MNHHLHKRLSPFLMLALIMCGSNQLVRSQVTKTGLSTSQSPYLLPLLTGYKTVSILSANDSVGGYKMTGVPDGLGAFDNGDGTFTLLMNHELLSNEGVVRAHGSIGAFVSKWIISKSKFKVVSGSDLIQNVKLWNGSGYNTYNAGNPSPLAAFNRFCSADLPGISAFYNSNSGKGTQERIYLNGEEVTEGRAIAHVVTGSEAGTSYQLPWFGRFSWENAVANPYAQDITIVGGMDDASITTSNVYFYVGNKTSTGSEIDKAGLSYGKLYAVKVSGFPQERVSTTSINNPPIAGTHFDLVDLGDVTNLTGAQLDSVSTVLGGTHFSRSEDGAWNPSSLTDFYFNTTDQIDQVNDGIGTQVGRSRLWHLHFTDITHPELGGTIEAALDGTEGQNMLDNMTIDKYGHITLLEDVGNSPHNGKVWEYDIARDRLIQIIKHDTARFGDVAIPATPPFTQDEESSGVIDMQDILGAGWYLIDDQAHYRTDIPADVVEGGQLLAIFNPHTLKSYNASLGVGPSTKQTPYLIPVADDVKFKAILSANDSVGGYKMTGVPDGLGAFDNGDGTFTLLMNHELLSNEGVVRAHGSIGAFVSKWVISKSRLKVLSGSDLIREVRLWNGSGYNSYNANHPSSLAAFNRFCSADLPAPTAFYNKKSHTGTQKIIYLNGEEVTDGRAMAHIVNGPNAGTSYQLPLLGRFSWENAVANPYSQDLTIVAGMDDASITTSNVYFYVGNKTNTGNEIEKAGLTNGKLYGVKVSGFPQERISTTVINNPPIAGTHFDLVDLGAVQSLSGTQLDSVSTAAGATHFSRSEDGAWNPSSLSDFYFNTTDQIDQVNDGIGTQVGRSRLWHLHFTDITHPETGGTIEAALDGTEGQNMLDNMTIDNNGHITLLEDVGNSPHNGKIWQYDIATDKLTLIGKHDPDRFGDVNIPATPPFTQDEETSGVIDVQNILGSGWYLLDDQAHYRTGIPADVVEGGQLLAMYNPSAASAAVTENVPADEEIAAATATTVKLRVSVSPNPTYSNTKVYVTGAKGNIAVILSDINGKIVWTSGSTNANQVSVPTEKFAKGTYIVSVKTDTEEANTKLVIAR